MTQNRASRRRKKITFEFRGEPGAKVFLAGSFNNWEPSAVRMEDGKEPGVYRATLFLPPGRHEYKFVVNGHWYADPASDDWVTNPYGTINSVTTVT